MLADVTDFSTMLKTSRCMGEILTAQVRFECSAKPREGFEHLLYPCSGPALLGHEIIFLLAHGMMN